MSNIVKTNSAPLAVTKMSAERLAVLETVATAMAQGRAYANWTHPAQILYAMVKAEELGFPASSAPDVFSNINGKLTINTQAAWGMVQASGLLEKIEVDEDDDMTYCKVTLWRGGIAHSYKFTWSNAEAAGLTKEGSNYHKWRKNMLYWRAMGFAMDRAFPDLLLGLPTSGKIDDSYAPAGRVDATSLIIEDNSDD